MQDILNARIKHREPFRPFAPAILEERTGEWFEKSYPSPFMLLTYPVRPEKRDLIPAPTHVDGTGRLQTVRRDQNERYYDLIRAFEDRTGVPVLLNTSFNENEPICCTPEAGGRHVRPHEDGPARAGRPCGREWGVVGWISVQLRKQPTSVRARTRGCPRGWPCRAAIVTTTSLAR